MYIVILPDYFWWMIAIFLLLFMGWVLLTFWLIWKSTLQVLQSCGNVEQMRLEVESLITRADVSLNRLRGRELV